jgi:hypothetical protein
MLGQYTFSQEHHRERFFDNYPSQMIGVPQLCRVLQFISYSLDSSFATLYA